MRSPSNLQIVSYKCIKQNAVQTESIRRMTSSDNVHNLYLRLFLFNLFDLGCNSLAHHDHTLIDVSFVN